MTDRQDVPGGRAGRCRHRLDTAPHRTWRGRTAGGSSGDLYVHLRVAAHDRYRRDGDDLVTEVPISIAQAALGTPFTLETLDGDEDLVVPAGTQPGREFVLRGPGRAAAAWAGPWRSAGSARVEVPTKLAEDEVELLRQFAERRGEQVIRRKRACSRASSRPSRDAPTVTRRCVGRRRTCSSSTSRDPALDEARVHHLAGCCDCVTARR